MYEYCTWGDPGAGYKDPRSDEHPHVHVHLPSARYPAPVALTGYGGGLHDHERTPDGSWRRRSRAGRGYLDGPPHSPHPPIRLELTNPVRADQTPRRSAGGGGCGGGLARNASLREPRSGETRGGKPRSCAAAVRSTEQPAPGDRSVSSPAEETPAAWTWEGLRLPLPRVSPDNNNPDRPRCGPRGERDNEVASPRRRWDPDHQGIGVEGRTRGNSGLDRRGGSRPTPARRSPQSDTHTWREGQVSYFLRTTWRSSKCQPERSARPQIRGPLRSLAQPTNRARLRRLSPDNWTVVGGGQEEAGDRRKNRRSRRHSARGGCAEAGQPSGD